MTAGSNQRPCDEIADVLVGLYGQTFGGKPGGKYRISRKFLRQVGGRRRLGPELLHDIGDELFERGFVFIDLETHFAVLEQKSFNSYRRVTEAAAALVDDPQAAAPGKAPRGKAGQGKVRRRAAGGAGSS